MQLERTSSFRNWYYDLSPPPSPLSIPPILDMSALTLAAPRTAIQQSVLKFPEMLIGIVGTSQPIILLYLAFSIDRIYGLSVRMVEEG